MADQAELIRAKLHEYVLDGNAIGPIIGLWTSIPRGGVPMTVKVKKDPLKNARGDLGQTAAMPALRARVGLNRPKFARMMSLSERSVAAFEAGKAMTPSVTRKVAEIRRLVDSLAEVVRGEAIGPWFDRPNSAFGGLKPLEVIERGEIDRLWAMIHALQSGEPG